MYRTYSGGECIVLTVEVNVSYLQWSRMYRTYSGGECIVLTVDVNVSYLQWR